MPGPWALLFFKPRQHVPARGHRVVVWVSGQHEHAGELSWLLWRLQAAATDHAFAGDAAGLRRQAETLPIDALWSVAARALRLSDAMCWDALTRGDTAAFTRQSSTGAELLEFGVCAGLLDQD